MKTERQEAILRIIAMQKVDTQEGLQQKLREEGFDVTQATVSRDIKNLNLIKITSDDGGYRYAPKLSQQEQNINKKYHSIFVDAVLDVDYAMNTVVIKCHVGMGNAACAAIDKMQLEGVVGTLAGDDTVFICMRDEHQAQKLVEQIGRILGR